ncbi:MAG: hypothetical protein KKA55_10605, partial [Proteobacteria bacterium]|nr:hypothetical protein [Pseudomonadota bacterium]MBU1595969.1 hypothetical protein [Pseudomonadota bacterium]
MLTNARGNRLWIIDETGEATPVRRPADIHARPRARHLPDWWVVEKAPDWRPTGETSLLRLGMTQNEDDARRTAQRWPGYEHDPGDGPGGRPGKPADDLGDDPGDDLGLDPDMAPATGPARGMKIGAGHKLQAYDQHGRYTGPRGGSMPIGDGRVRLFGAEGLAATGGGETQEPSAEGLETVSKTLEQAREQAEQAAQKAAEEARQAAEEMARAAQEASEAAEASTKTLEGVLLADNTKTRTDAGGGLSGGYEVRGPVNPPETSPFPPPPPAPKEPHLTYSHKSGNLTGPDGAHLGTGYAGQKEGKNNTNAEGI